MTDQNKDERAYKVLWIIFAVLLVSLHFIDSLPFTTFVIGIFLSPELIAVADSVRKNTFSEFNWTHVPHPILRWMIAIDIVILAYIRLPEPWNQIAALGLGFWLPFHFAFPGIERKAIRKLLRMDT